MGSSRLPDSVERPETEEERFKSFVNKLSNACDNVKGGKTVSAVAVLQHKDGICYVMGCNQLSYSNLKTASDFLSKLLGKISGVSDLEDGERRKLKSKVLALLVAFHRPRVKLYMKNLREDAESCLATLQTRTDFEGMVCTSFPS